MTHAKPTPHPRPKLGTHLFAVSAAITAVPVAYVVFAWLHAADVDYFDAAIKNLGFELAVPPSRLYRPGSLYVVDAHGHITSIVCGVPETLYNEYVEISSTTSLAAQQRLSGGLSTAALVDEINAKIGARAVKKVSVRLTDVSVLAITMGNLNRIGTTLMSDQFCSETVAKLLAQGFPVCQGQSILEANAVYQIEYATGASLGASVKDAALPALQNSLKAIPQESSSSMSAADGLKSGAAGSSGTADIEQTRFQSGVRLFYGYTVAPLCLTPSTAQSPRFRPSGSPSEIVAAATPTAAANEASGSSSSTRSQ